MGTKAKQAETKRTQGAEGLVARAQAEVRRLEKEGSPETQRALELLICAQRVKVWLIDRDCPISGENTEQTKRVEILAKESEARLSTLLG